MMLRLDREAPLQHQIYDQLNHAILSGLTAPGNRIDNRWCRPIEAEK